MQLAGSSNKLSLDEAKAKSKKRHSEESEKKRKKAKPSDDIDDDIDEVDDDIADDDDDDDDEIIGESENNRAQGKKNTVLVIAAIAIVAVVLLVFLLFRGKSHKEVEQPVVDTTTQQEQVVEPSKGEQEEPYSPNVGTQNFLEDTNNRSDSSLEDPEGFVEDINGLTTRCDYEVKGIYSAADFVSYKKHRGTWGGGLELYWLEAEYRDNKYVVQVPFEYYKELNDTGIVPVKMEVLKVLSPTSAEPLTVISYMRLDEQTLKEVLKSQSK